jgi:hypothetical protein
MDYDTLKLLVDKINGCSFATIDSVTYPLAGVRCETTGERVIMFTNKRCSGYDNMVRRRLVEAGKNPDDFVLSDLPWGERIPETPFIAHRDKIYLQTIVLQGGVSRYYIGNREVSPEGLLPSSRTNQGLPKGDEVKVHTFKLESIVRIHLMNEVLTADAPSRSILRLKDRR